MSVNYAAGLSNYPHIHKGKCGLPEVQDPSGDIEVKIERLVSLVKSSKYIVMHTGAGISTSAGIPDFRGPKGVWTLESQGRKPVVNINFDEAKPTVTHMAILGLQQCGIVKYCVSQNIDGLHLRSGYPRCQLSELHGNMFVEKCEKCFHENYRRTPVSTMAQKRTGNVCQQPGKRGLSNCRGKLRDTILDWEDSLPIEDLVNAENQSKLADLSICLGTTLQVEPSGRLPMMTKKKGGKLVIINLQKTKYDKKADLVIHDYVDNVMKRLIIGLGIEIPEFNIDLYHSLITSILPDDIKKIDDNINDGNETILDNIPLKRKMKEEDSDNSVTNNEGSVTSIDGSVTNNDGSVIKNDGSVTNNDSEVKEEIFKDDNIKKQCIDS